METTADARWRNVIAIWRDNRWLYLLSGVLIGTLIGPAVAQLTGNGQETLGNLVPEAIGIIFTVLILDRLVDNRNREALKQRLMNELRSPATGQGTAALAWLRREGWLHADTLIGADLHRVNWENAYIGGLQLTNANLNGAILTNVSSQTTDEHGRRNEQPISLHGASLRHAVLEDAVLIEADFNEANMWKVHMAGAVLARSTFRGANLGSADLRRANLCGASLAGAVIDGVQLEGVTLPDSSLWTEDTDMGRFTDEQHPQFQATLKKIGKAGQQIFRTSVDD